MGRVNCTQIDTSPGENNVFSPPLGWSGSSEEYLKLMRQRYRHVETSQHMIVAVRHRVSAEIKGPYAKEAKNILESLT